MPLEVLFRSLPLSFVPSFRTSAQNKHTLKIIYETPLLCLKDLLFWRQKKYLQETNWRTENRTSQKGRKHTSCIARQKMSQNPSPHPHPSNLTWGLGVPGRPSTPSEGFAQVKCYNPLGVTELTLANQAYHRVGPAATQRTRKFDNGTCLSFGPLVRRRAKTCVCYV